MKFRPLVIDDNSRMEIKRVTGWAEIHRLSIHDLFAILKGTRSPPGDDPNFTCVIPLGYRCVFTIEQDINGVWARHLSISVIGGPAPGVPAVEMLLHEFGMLCSINELGLPGHYPPPDGFNIEDLGEGRKAIGVWQKIVYKKA